jgi:hypothetical protein
MSAIAERPESLFDIPGCEFTPTSLTLPEGLSFEHWERIGRQLQLADMAVQWWIGDWLVYGETAYYDRYSQALEDMTGRKTQTLMNYAYVAKSIEISRRRENVDFSTHAEVASLDPEDQEKVLAKAAKEHQSRNTVRREAEKIKRAKKPKPNETDFVLPKEARECLDDYMGELAKFGEQFLQPGWHSVELMLHSHGKDALWQRTRTVETDCQAIVKMFTGEAGSPGTERSSDGEISVWLEQSGYFMSDADLDERLSLMVEKKMLDVMSVEESRQDGRRGILIDLYALNPDYLSRLET